MLTRKYLLRTIMVIALVLSTIFVFSPSKVEAQTSPIISDGFEGGSRGSYSTSGETVTVSSNRPHHGEYGGRFTTNGGGGTERAYYYYNLGEDMTSLYVRAYFYISSGLPLDDNNDRFMLIGFFNDGSAIASTGIRRVSGQDRFYQICLDGSDSSTSIYPGEGEYYCVESYWKRGYSGEMKTWVNGELLLSNSPANTGNLGINQVRIGLSFVTGINHGITIYADCVVIDDNYIGTEGSAPPPPPPPPPPAGDILVSVYRSQVVGTNKLSLGFLMNNEWDEWRDRTSLRTLARDADFKLIRIWSDRIEPCSRWYESTKTGTYNWASVDLLVQRIFDVGAEPLICLGFYDWARNRLRMPVGMATNPYTGLPYPDSYAAYAEDWVQHFKAVGLPVRYYQIINEPHQYFGWNGADPVKLQNYIDLFRAVANRMRAANPNVRLSNDCTLQKRVLDGFIRNGVKLDYLSFNKYDSAGSPSDEEMFNRAETRFIEESSSIYGVDRARQVYYNARGVWLPVIISEYNFSHEYEDGTDPRIQKVVAVVWASLMLRTCILKDVNYALYATFASSKSSEMRKPSGGFGFGMVNLDDSKPWYPYYLQKMIGNNLDVGDQLVQVTSSSTDVRPLAWIHDGKLTVLLIYKSKAQKTVSLSGLQGQLSLQKIDDSISYLNPSVQTDLISSGDILPMNGYTVVLLQES